MNNINNKDIDLFNLNQSLSKLKSNIIIKHIGNEKENHISFSEVIKLIKSFKLEHKINEKEAKMLFDRIDYEKKGKIKKTDFLEQLENNQSEMKILYNQLKDLFKCKSDIIFEKLSKILTFFQSINQNELINETIWIMDTISNYNIYEPELYSDDNPIESNQFLSMLPSVENNITKLKDIEQFKISADKKRSTIFLTPSKKISSRIDLKSILHTQNLSFCYNSLEDIDDLQFNIFNHSKSLGKSLLKSISYEIFNREGYFNDLLSAREYNCFIQEVTDGYNKNNPYHNDLHAADVLQTVYCMIVHGNIEKKLELEELDTLSLLLAALMHDYKHPGVNNSFLINSKNKLAIKYNDHSVLESMHASETFKLISKRECNIFSSLSNQEYRIMRRRVIECILSTDMTYHPKHYSQLKNKIDTLCIESGKGIEKLISSDNIGKNFDNQQLILNMILHAADISNPTKPIDIYKKWVDLVFDEFFSQGDLEKGNKIPISINCDRDIIKIPKTQIGFISLVVKPTFELINHIIPECCEVYLQNIEYNYKYYEECDNSNYNYSK